MKILLVDNYDSFTYNMVGCLHRLGLTDITIQMNDRVDIEHLSGYAVILLSPGPSLPHESGRLLELLHHLRPQQAVLGVCLGHQALVHHCGGRLRHLASPRHGYQTQLEILDSDPLFKNIENHPTVGLYHSWTAEEIGWPATLKILARSREGDIMAIRHRKYPWYGVQFHPESYMTPEGLQLFQNFFAYVAKLDFMDANETI